MRFTIGRGERMKKLMILLLAMVIIGECAPVITNQSME